MAEPITVVTTYQGLPLIPRMLVTNGSVDVEFEIGGTWVLSESFPTGARVIYCGGADFRVTPKAGSAFLLV